MLCRFVAELEVILLDYRYDINSGNMFEAPFNSLWPEALYMWPFYGLQKYDKFKNKISWLYAVHRVGVCSASM